jgi:hypothetical protein
MVFPFALSYRSFPVIEIHFGEQRACEAPAALFKVHTDNIGTAIGEL